MYIIGHVYYKTINQIALDLKVQANTVQLVKEAWWTILNTLYEKGMEGLKLGGLN